MNIERESGLNNNYAKLIHNSLNLPKYYPPPILEKIIEQIPKKKKNQYELYYIETPTGHKIELLKVKKGNKEFIMHNKMYEKLNTLSDYFKDILGQDIFSYITSLYRSPEEQKQLYNRWLNKDPDIVHKPSEAWHSKHNYGAAVDLAISRIPKEKFPAVVEQMKRIGFKWGGDFGDPVHFELPELNKWIEKIKPKRSKNWHSTK